MGNKTQILAAITAVTVIASGIVIFKSLFSDKQNIIPNQHDNDSESISSEEPIDSKSPSEDRSESYIIDDDENIQQNAPNELFHYASGMDINNFKDNYVYNGNEITLSVTINNFMSGFDESFLLYVNGIQNPYHTDFDKNDKLYHTINIPDEESVTVEIYFKPMNCNIGDTVLVSFDRVMNMDYMLPDTSWVSFYPNHELNGIYPFPLEIKSDCDKTENTSIEQENKWEETEIPIDILEEYINTDEFGNLVGDSSINESAHFELVQNDRYESYYVTYDDSIELTLNGYGKAGTYRVGVYVDHKLVPAFDDNYYSDMEIINGKMLFRKITIDTSKFEGLHHIYAIAIPLEDNELTTAKTKTKLLSIEDAPKLDSEIVHA